MKVMWKRTIKILMVFAIILYGIHILPGQRAFAAGPVHICAVSYTDESILVLNNGNTKIYYATDKDAAKGRWEVIKASSDEITPIDVSFLSSSTENVIMVRGDSDTSKSRVVLKRRPLRLAVSINYSKMPTLSSSDTIGTLLNVMSSAGTAEDPISYSDLQWKKGEDGHWMDTSLLTKEILETYLVKGAYLYFRVAPIDDVVDAAIGGSDYTNQIRTYAFMYAYTKYFGDASYPASAFTFGSNYPDGTHGRRASSDVRLKITKKQSFPPVTTIDGKEFKVKIKYGQEYRVTFSGGITPTSWTQVNDKSTRELSLADIVNDGSDGVTDPFPEMKIEIRDYATEKKSASKISITELDNQREITGNILEQPVPSDVTSANQNIYVSYNGMKNLIVTIPSASKENPYEYCVVKQGASFDIEKARWSSITKNSAVKILASKAVDKSTIYFRMKEIKYKAATRLSLAIDFQMASTCKTFSVSYPSIPTAIKQTYVYTKGYSSNIEIDVTLNEAGNLPYETALKYIKLGTKDVSVVSSNVTPAIIGTPDPATVYTMKIILSGTALNSMTNCTSKALSIYYENGTVDKTSSRLTIKNPTSSGTLTTTSSKGTATGTTAITVVNSLGMGNSYVYELGTVEVKDKNTEDTMTSGITFNSGMDIMVGTSTYITIYEIDSGFHIIRYKCIEITSDIIK